jgi:hypothetical protein
MNTDALYEFLSLIQEDYKNRKIIQILGQLTEALNLMISNPGQPQFQVAFATAKGQITKALSESASNTISPKQKLMAAEMEIEELLGDNLKDKLQKLIDENQMTPAAIQKPLQALNARVAGFINSTNSLVTSFDDLIPFGNDSNKCEMGVLIPNRYTGKDLSSVVNEILEFEELYLNIEEICENSRATPKIVSMSTTDPMIVIAASYKICACFAKTVEWILNTYKGIMEIRKLRSDLLEKGITEQAVQEIDKEANGRIEKSIQEVVEKTIAEFFKSEDKGRGHELRVELKKNLLKVAYKIDNGFAYEIKVKKPQSADASKAAEQSLTAIDKELLDSIETSSRGIMFTNLTGKPILRLPAPENDGHKTAEKADKSPKSK